jgi:hypothetical protein
MKFIRISICGIIVLVSCTFATFSQPAKRQANLKCSTNRVSFVCPDWQFKTAKATDLPFTAYDEQSKTTIFAFAPKTPIKNPDTLRNIASKVVYAVFGKDLAAFDVKQSNDFWGNDKFSKYEKSRLAEVGFCADLEKSIHYHVVNLMKNGQMIIVGFVYEAESGATAKEWFSKWNGGGMMTATYGLQELINSITGEKKKDYEAPGGPPPMAAPAKKPN